MIQDVRLQQFRSYANESFEFEPGVNIIVGPNGSGKTNLLEALLVACSGRSYRAKDSELVQFEAPWARIDMQTDAHERVVKLVREGVDVVKKEFVVDDYSLRRLVQQRKIPVILFEPNHLQLLHGSPERRREYFDVILSEIKPGYAKLLRDFKRTLAQRNALLKKQAYTKDQMFIWNVRLSELAGQIASSRQEIIGTFNNRIEEVYQSLAVSKDIVEIQYHSACNSNEYSSHLLKLLEANEYRDRERGFTSVGPHRDDIVFFLRGREASTLASRGETRTLLLSLKIIEMKLIEEAYDKQPILLFDDVFSELDGARRRALTEVMKDHQTFITTTDADVVVQHFMQTSHIIPLTA